MPHRAFNRQASGAEAVRGGWLSAYRVPDPRLNPAADQRDPKSVRYAIDARAPDGL